MSILSELYHGNISPYDRPTERTEEYQKLTKQIEKVEEKLKSELSPEQWRLYEKCVGLLLERQEIHEEQVFREAFSSGAQIMLEVVTEKNV